MLLDTSAAASVVAVTKRRHAHSLIPQTYFNVVLTALADCDVATSWIMNDDDYISHSSACFEMERQRQPGAGAYGGRGADGGRACLISR